MPIKDPEKRREYARKYAKRKLGQKKLRQYIRSFTNEFHDFETHRGLAMSSGIRTQMEWRECHQRGFMPDGIYSSPEKVFRRK